MQPIYTDSPRSGKAGNTLEQTGSVNARDDEAGIEARNKQAQQTVSARFPRGTTTPAHAR